MPEKQTTQSKSGERLKQTFLQRPTDGKQTHENILNITHYERNVNQIYNEISSQTSQNGHQQKLYKQQMLVRMWGKGYPLALLVGM